jgi:hypothetical protein
METEPISTNNMSLFIEDEILQNMSDESDHIDAPMDDVISEAVESDLDEYEEALFDDAFNDLHHPQTIEWPNDAYRDFMELINIYQLSNSAGSERCISYFYEIN